MKGKKKRTSVWGVIGLMLTVAIALLLPQLVFMVQDYRQIASVEIVNRDTYEILTTETTYPADINTRMAKLAGTPYGEITVARIASSIDINDYNTMLSDVKRQKYMTNMAEMLPVSFGETLNTLNAMQMTVCDNYIVYSDDYKDGVILMFWYMKFDLPEQNGYMELIVDSNTNTVYYVRLRENFAQENDEATAEHIVSGEDYYYDKLSQNVAMIPTMSPEIEAVVAQFPEYFCEYYCSYYGIYMVNVDYLSSTSFLWDRISLGENVYTLAYALPYNSNGTDTLFFRLHVEAGPETDTDISIGIPIIRRMVQS